MAIYERKLISGKIVFRVEVQDPEGNWYPKKQFAKKWEAKEYEAKLISLKGKGSKASQTKHRELTISRYYHDTYKLFARTKVSQGQRDVENQLFRDHVEPYIGNINVISVVKSDIAKVLTYELTTKKNLGSSQVTHVYNLLNQLFNYAIEVSDIRDSNPVLKRFKPEADDHVPAYFKPESARDFFDTVRDHWMGPAIWIMAGTALRVGEVIGLQYQDIDLKTRTIYLRRAWCRKEKKITKVKNKKAEKATPINVQLAEYLETKLSPTAQPTDWVIRSKRYPKKMASYHSLYGALRRLCTANGLVNVPPHGLRHTTSGLWNEIGAETKDLTNIYNHGDESTTKRYNHEVPDRLHELGERVWMDKRKEQPVVKH